jgi:uncharacterized membrane protein HdeD (DUF308 family)
VYALFSAIAVPALKHWWILVPACFGVVLLVAGAFHAAKKFSDRWQTLSEQIRFLSESVKEKA